MNKNFIFKSTFLLFSFIGFLNQNFAQSTKIILSPSMVTDEVTGVSSATALVDEQNIMGDPLNGIGPISNSTSVWRPTWNSPSYPISAYINLGKAYKITNIFLADTPPQEVSSFKVEYGTPGNWTQLFIDPLSDWQNWSRHDVNITTQYLRFTMADVNASCWEIVLYGVSALKTSADHNYSQVETIRVSGKTTDAQIDVLPVEQKNTAIQYLDLVGKPEQSIVYQGSPGKNDIVQPMVYDNLGRESQKYLAYTDNGDNAFKPSAITNQTAFYQTLKADTRSYGTAQFESSPLGRPLKQLQVGTAPQTNGDPALSASLQYGTNADNEVIRWDYDAATGKANGTSFYPASSLYLTTMIDAGLMKSKTFKNQSGQVVCTKVQKKYNDESVYLATYYVYDDFGNTMFIVPPMAVNSLASVNNTLTWNDTFCQNWLFAFQYDIRQRPLAKINPNGGITYIIYDPLDRPILTQDATQRVLNQWSFIKYDVLGRAILKGRYTAASAVTQAQMQTNVDTYYSSAILPNYYESRNNTDYANLHGYSNQAFPVIPSPYTQNTQIQSVTYYDDYDLDYNGVENEAAKYERSYFVSAGYESTPALSTRGLVTATKDIILPSSDNANFWVYTYSFYDEEGGVIQVQKDYSGMVSTLGADGTRKVDIISNRYDFEGKLLKSEHRHLQSIATNTPSLIIKRRYDYDHAGRTIASYLQLNTEAEVKIASYVYNEIRELIQKSLGNTLQTIDYSYDINGRMTGINSQKVNNDILQAGALYSLSLGYNLVADNHTNSYYAPPGRLKSRAWWSANNPGQFQDNYQFDDLGRISYTFSPALDFKNNNFRAYQSNNTYDDNGNILYMERINLASKSPNNPDKLDYVDKLTYSYGSNSNQLRAVEDAITTPTLSNDFKEKAHESIEYGYDVAGKLQSDKNKGITGTSYNDLDLPIFISFDNTGDNYIFNFYAASGEKIESDILAAGSNTTTKYISGLVYINDALQFIPHEEGRILPPEITGKSTWTYEYDYRDNLGSLVMSFRQPDNIPTQTATIEPTSSTAWSFADGAVRNNERQYSGNYSAKLSSSSPIGAWKTIKVAKGDVVTMGAYGSYTKVPSNNTATNLIPFAASIPLQGTETGNKANLLSLGLSINPIIFGSVTSNVPNAYLEFIFTGVDNTVIKNERQYISVAANSAWENVKIIYTAENEGYLQVFVANESDSPVWFDDVSIQVQQSPIAQETHYDVWGVELAGLEKRGHPEDEYKFQDKELIEDLGLYQYDFGARYYDPQLGRWSVTDPANQFASGYTGMGNDPVNGIDPDGKFWHIIIGAIIGGVVNTISHAGEIHSFKDGLVAFSIGAAGGAVTAATGGAAAGAFGLSATGAGFISGAVVGGVGSAFGGPVTGIGNAAYFGDEYGAKDWLKGVATGAAIGGVAGGIASWIKGRNVFTDKTRLDGESLFKFRIDEITNRGSGGLGGDLIFEGVVDGPNNIGNLTKGQPLYSYSDLTKQIKAKLSLYPEIMDLRSGRNIKFPSEINGKIDKSLKVIWDKSSRAEFIREWYERGYQTPKGGWKAYDIHHILPREYGGNNNFWNLVPVERSTHQQLLNTFWQQFKDL